MHSDYRALHRAEYTWHLLYQTILWNKYNDKQLRHSERANSWSTAPHCCLPSVVLDLFQYFIGLKWILSVKRHAGRVYTAYHVSRIDLVAPRPRSILSTWYAVYTCPLCLLTNVTLQPMIICKHNIQIKAPWKSMWQHTQWLSWFDVCAVYQPYSVS